MRLYIPILLAIFGVVSSVTAQDVQQTQIVWSANLDPAYNINPPICAGYPADGMRKGAVYKLCLPSSIVRGLKISAQNKSVILKGPGEIRGPVLVNTNPPILLIGSMQVIKGTLSVTISPSGGYELKGLSGAFEIQGLIAPLLATKPMAIDSLQLQFTSPEDALLQLDASGQQVGIVLRVEFSSEYRMTFIPSTPGFSIFPHNPFFEKFSGRYSQNGPVKTLNLILKDGSQLILNENLESE